MQFRNTIRLTVAVAATGALVTGVRMFHAGSDLQTAGHLVRVSLAVLALIIASLSLEIGRAIDSLAAAATGQADRLQGYEARIDQDADYVRRWWIAGQIVAGLLILPTAALVWYFNNSVTTFLFGTPGTRFMVSRFQGDFGIIVYCCTLCAAIQPVRFGLLLLIAKASPLGAARVASEQETVIPGWKGAYIWLSPMDYFRLFFALLTACLLANVVPAVSYAKITGRGIGFVDPFGTTEVFHPWADVCSITETHSTSDGSSDHIYTVQFSDGSEWKSGSISDDLPFSILQRDPKAEIEFAADRANLPLRICHD